MADQISQRDPNRVTGLIVVDADTLGAADEDVIIVTGRKLTSSQPIDVALVDGDGTHITSPGTSKADDSAFTVGSDSLTPIGYLVDEVTPDSVDEGDVGTPRMSLNRIPYAIIRDAAGNERGLNVDSLGRITVVVNGNVSVIGEVAHGTTDSGAPQKIGGFASATAPTPVDANDRVNAWFGLEGDQKVSHTVTGIGDGVTTVTTAGTDVALAGSTAAKEVTIQAMDTNTGLIAVGASGVDATSGSGTGIILYAGDSVTLKCDNLADIFVDATVNGEKCRFLYLS